MKKVELATLGQENAFDLIGKEWMLVTSGSTERYNTMTASWGGIGWLWNKPVAFIFVRPERYTHQFIEQNDQLTLSFYPEAYREALKLCGSKSGRDTDKAKETGLVPVAVGVQNVTFEQARMTLVCRKLFKTEMEKANFLEQSLLERWYNDQPGGGLHTIYIVEIEEIYTNEE